ncbi:MAG: hypothetical protein ACREMH_09055, partial [Gemmatimonadales bacterium]
MTFDLLPSTFDQDNPTSRRYGLSPLARWWPLGTALFLVAAREWLAEPRPGWALGAAGLAAVAAFLALVSRRPRAPW